METKRYVVCLIAVLFSVFIFSTEASAKVLSYESWKAKRVSEARSLVTQIQSNLKRLKKGESLEVEQARLEQARLNVDIARELTAADYFVLYLSPQFRGNRSAFARATKGMKTRDIVDILVAYEAKLNEKLIPENIESVKFLLPKKPDREWGSRPLTRVAPEAATRSH